MKRTEQATVLVVEDEPMVGEMIQAMLEHVGYRVVGRALSGEQAIRLTGELRPDVVLMDIGLPDMDGIQASERISRESPVPVVILSAYDTPALLERATQAGVGAYLVKPADIREMERAIAVALARFEDMIELRRLNRELEAEIAERRRVEHELRASEERFRTAVEYSHDWEDWLAPDGAFIYVSPACERITGYAREEFVANPRLLLDITVPEDRHLVLLTGGGADEPPHEYQFRITTRGGEGRWIERVCQPVHRDDGEFLGWRTSNRDVTDRKRLEERLREARKMEAVGQLAGGLAHDLNNLLTVINGYADLSLEEAAGNEGLTADLAEIRKAGERASQVIAQLLAYSRQQLLRLSAVDPNGLILGMRDELADAAGEGVELRLELADDVNPVRIDADRLRQGLLEMASNAGLAMAAGGTLTLETQNVVLSEEEVSEYRDLAPGDYVVVRVRDTGVGMSEETRDRIFEPFFTTRDRAESDGLGLSAVYGMIRQVGGLIEVISEPEVGTTFEIYLPRA